MSRRDPFELFRALQPLADHGVDERPDDALLADVFATPAPERRRPWWRRWWPFGVGVGVIAVATASFVMLRSEPLSDPTTVACLGAVDLDGDIWVLPAAEDPVAACEGLWARGEIGDGTVPELSACVNDAGIATVIPDDQSGCAELGLPVLEAGFTDEQRTVLELQDRLIEEFNRSCIGQDDAIATAERLLDDLDLDGWSAVIAEDFPDGMDCAGIGIEVRTRTVILLGVRPS